MWKRKRSRFTQKFIQNYGDDSNKGYILEVDVSYLRHLQKKYSEIQFLDNILVSFYLW